LIEIVIGFAIMGATGNGCRRVPGAKHQQCVNIVMPDKIYLTGRVPNTRLTIICEAEPRKFKHGKWMCAVRYWKCKCDCGTIVEVQQAALRKGRIKSCGCYNRDTQRARLTKHGAVDTRTYSSWKHMKARVTNPNHESYKNYGGRGIVICERWLDSFENFREDMGECPPKHTIDRIDNNAGYCKENCQWSDKKTQDRNRRTTKFITAFGITACIIEMCERFHIHVTTFYHRLAKGWTIEKSLTEPVGLTGVRAAKPAPPEPTNPSS